MEVRRVQQPRFGRIDAIRQQLEKQLDVSHRVTHGLASSAERFRATWW